MSEIISYPGSLSSGKRDRASDRIKEKIQVRICYSRPAQADVIAPARRARATPMIQRNSRVIISGEWRTVATTYVVRNRISVRI